MDLESISKPPEIKRGIDAPPPEFANKIVEQDKTNDSNAPSSQAVVQLSEQAVNRLIESERAEADRQKERQLEGSSTDARFFDDPERARERNDENLSVNARSVQSQVSEDKVDRRREITGEFFVIEGEKAIETRPEKKLDELV